MAGRVTYEEGRSVGKHTGKSVGYELPPSVMVNTRLDCCTLRVGTGGSVDTLHERDALFR